MILHRAARRDFKQFYSLAMIFFLCVTSLFFSGCSMIMSSATSDMMEHLSLSILNNDDLSMVKQGAPAYLIMIDSLISKDPDNEDLLSTAAMLYSAYSDLFVRDALRSRKMADKALSYATKAMCIEKKEACTLRSDTFEEFEKKISSMGKSRVPALFALGNAWAGWIMANSNDFNAVADISRIELIMQKIVELDKTYKDGAAYLYLGTLATLLPPALGGEPEKGKSYFEEAVKLSRGKNLMVKVVYAQLYARMIFDRKLHDQLLQEVIDSDPYASGYTLVNTRAQIQAKELLASADDYF